jgi:opacity protein-like surface antigen
MKLATTIALGTALVAATAWPARAQLFYVGVRAGAAVPTGGFSEEGQSTGNDALLTGATPGLGYGLDAGIGSGLFGFYAGYDRIQFNCADASCATSGKYELEGYSGGVRVGVPLLPLLKPWAKAGVTLNEMTGTLGGSAGEQVRTKRRLGYEIGAGVDIPVLGGFFNITPQVRHVRQSLEPYIPSSSSTTGGKKPANYYTFDIGLRLRSPI